MSDLETKLNTMEARLTNIESMLEQLLRYQRAEHQVISNEQARQLMTCTDEQRKAHNKAVIAAARERQRLKQR